MFFFKTLERILYKFGGPIRIIAQMINDFRDIESLFSYPKRKLKKVENHEPSKISNEEEN